MMFVYGHLVTKSDRASTIVNICSNNEFYIKLYVNENVKHIRQYFIWNLKGLINGTKQIRIQKIIDENKTNIICF
jgi:hypothetical protein